MDEKWIWIYIALSGLNDMLVEVPVEIGDAMFEGRDIPKNFKVRHFTTVKVRKESLDETQTRTKASNIETSTQETIIETFPWAIEREEAVSHGVMFSHAIAWVRRPCEALITAAEALWTEK